MKGLPASARAYVLSVIVLGGLAVVVVPLLPASRPTFTIPVLIFAAAALLTQLQGVRVVSAGRQGQAWSLLSSVLIATIILFPLGSVILLVLLTLGAYWLKRRYPWYQGLFNIAQHEIAIVLAAVVWQWGRPPGAVGFHAVQWYAAAFAAGLTFYLTNGLLVTLAIALTEGRSPLQVGVLSRGSFYRELVLIWLSVLVADLWRLNPWLTSLLAMPLVAFSQMLRMHLEDTERTLRSQLDAENRARQLASLNELTRALTSSLERSDVYEVLYTQIRKSFELEAFAVAFYDFHAHQVKFGFVRSGQRTLAAYVRSASEPILSRLLHARGPVVLDANRDRDAIEGLSPARQLAGASGITAVPLTLGERTMGFIVLGPRQPLSEQDLALLSTMASQAAVALDKAQLFESLQMQMAALEQTQLQLLQSAKLATIGELAAFIAHEINNPLTSVLGYASLILSETAPNDPKRSDLEVIEKEALRARAIVRDLLGYARQTDSVMEATHVNAAIESVLPLAKRRAEMHHVTIASRLDPSLPPISADVSQLKQVIINILNNAIDAMPQGGEVEVSTRQVTTNGIGPRVEVAFQDHGVGIPAEHLSKIFDPFFTTKEAGKGTGLGLPITKRIVERHGGSVEVTSEEGRGTRFTIQLPVPPSR